MTPRGEGVLTLVPAGGKRCLYGKWFGTGTRLRLGQRPCPNRAAPDSVYCESCRRAAWVRVRSVKP